MMYTVDNTTSTSATLSNLQCNTEYIIFVYVEGGRILTGIRSAPRIVSLPARGMHLPFIWHFTVYMYYCTTPAPPTPTNITTWLIECLKCQGSIWQWTSSDPASNCFNTTTVTYHPEGGGKSSLQLSDPAATEVTLTDLQCNTSYTITVVTTAGQHKRESVAI